MNIIIPWNETVNTAVLKTLQLPLTSSNHLGIPEKDIYKYRINTELQQPLTSKI